MANAISGTRTATRHPTATPRPAPLTARDVAKAIRSNPIVAREAMLDVLAEPLGELLGEMFQETTRHG
jgi:hypothetical protein